MKDIEQIKECLEEWGMEDLCNLNDTLYGENDESEIAAKWYYEREILSQEQLIEKALIKLENVSIETFRELEVDYNIENRDLS